MTEEAAGLSRLATGRVLFVRTASDADEGVYQLHDETGALLAIVHRRDIPPERSGLGRIVGWLGWGAMETVALDVVDPAGAPILTVRFPGEDRQYRGIVQDGGGRDEIGELVKARGIRKIHFDLKAGAEVLGTVDAEGWTGWSFQVRVDGSLVGRIDMIDGSNAPEGFPDSGGYLLRLDQELHHSVRTLVAACAIGLDVSTQTTADPFS